MEEGDEVRRGKKRKPDPSFSFEEETCPSIDSYAIYRVVAHMHTLIRSYLLTHGRGWGLNFGAIVFTQIFTKQGSTTDECMHFFALMTSN